MRAPLLLGRPDAHSLATLPVALPMVSPPFWDCARQRARWFSTIQIEAGESPLEALGFDAVAAMRCKRLANQACCSTAVHPRPSCRLRAVASTPCPPLGTKQAAPCPGLRRTAVRPLLAPGATHEGVPDGGALAVLVPSPLDLVGARGAAPVDLAAQLLAA